MSVVAVEPDQFLRLEHIDVEMLEPEELIWLNCYHAHVLAKIGPNLKGEDLEWLQAACAPIEQR